MIRIFSCMNWILNVCSTLKILKATLKVYLGHCQTSVWSFFEKIVIGWKFLTILGLIALILVGYFIKFDFHTAKLNLTYTLNRTQKRHFEDRCYRRSDRKYCWASTKMKQAWTSVTSFSKTMHAECCTKYQVSSTFLTHFMLCGREG